MIKFYPNRTIEERASRLPQQYRFDYLVTQLDQVEIDGLTLHGYFEFSFLNERSYFEQPVRSSNGSIENINEYATFLTPRLVIKYNMMNIEDYRNLMTLLQSKNEFTVTCYDPVSNSRVTHKMYAAPPQMPVIYQQYLTVMGIQEFSLELIGTNNDVKEYTVTYDYNIPYGYEGSFTQQSATQTFAQNASDIIGKQATYTIDGVSYPLNSQQSQQLLGNRYIFQGWNTEAYGTGFTYMDGDAYYINRTQTLYAQWRYTGGNL